MTPQPAIEYESIKTALEAMRQGHKLAINHPLRYCLCMQLERGGGFGRHIDGIVHDTVIYDRLAGAIRRKLNRHRALYGLAPVVRHADFEEVQTAIVEDFQQSNSELKAWSFLYYRVVRVDLDLHVDDLIRLTPEDRRTLQRRQAHGIHRLTESLNRIENRLRLKYRQAEQRSRLLFPTAPRLLGREALIEQARQRLTGTQFPQHVLLYGPSGIGKTALALAIAHQLIDVEKLSNVLWLNVAAIGGKNLLETLVRELGLPTSHELPVSIFLTADDLIVLDNAETLFSESESRNQFIRMIGQARLILCSAIAPDASGWNYLPIQVPPLGMEDSFAYMAETAQGATGQDDVAYFNQFYAEIGGNPGALRSALRGNLSAALVSDRLYSVVWAQSAALAQLIWIAITLTHEGYISSSELHTLISDQPAEEIDTATAMLRNVGVIELARGSLRLAAAARTYGEQIIRDPQHRQLVTVVVNLWKDRLAQTPRIASCLRIIEGMQAANLAPEVQLDAVYAFASAIQYGGAWLTWTHILEVLRPAVGLTDQLWIGIRLGIARRWLAQWDAAGYILAEVIQAAGSVGAFDVQAKAMLELATVQRYQRRYDAGAQLIERSERYYQRHEVIEGLVQISLERALLALTTDDWKAARTALETLYDYEGQDSARVLSLSAQVAYQAEALPDALNLALMAQAAQADDLPRQGRTAAFLGQVYEKLGERDAAIDQLLGGIKLMGQTGDRYGYARARMNLAAVYLGQGNLRTALDYLRELPIEFEAMGDIESLQATAANLDMLNKATRQWRRGG